ncbi:hypothetical protein PTKIN_Ptkin08bG0034800 [Pterospermum kingtungense]
MEQRTSNRSVVDSKRPPMKKNFKRGEPMLALRDDRSYRDVMAGGSVRDNHSGNIRNKGVAKNDQDAKRKSRPDPGRCSVMDMDMSLKDNCLNISTEGKWEEEVSRDTLVFDQTALGSDMEWLSSCAIGTVKDCYIPGDIKKGLEELGFTVQVCPLGGCLVLLRFNSCIKMSEFLTKHSTDASRWFEDLRQWSISSMVESKLIIPSVVSVKCEEYVYKIVTALEEDIKPDGSQMDMDTDLEINSSMNCQSCRKLVDQRSQQEVRAETTPDISAEAVHWVMREIDVGQCEFSLKLSEEDLIGSEKAFIKNRLEEVTSNVSINNEMSHMDEFTACEINRQLDENGEFGEELGIGSMANGLEIVPYIRPNDDHNGLAKTQGRGDISKQVSKKNRVRSYLKGINRIMYGNNFKGGEFSDDSISDEDICNRNKVIARESEAHWEVEEKVGFSYVRNHM